MKKVVVFGSIGIAARCMEYFLTIPEIEIIGVCCEKVEDNWRKKNGDVDDVYTLAINNNIKILNHEEILDLKPDLGFSIRYNKLIKKEIIDCFKIGIFNTHGGVLPEYRGVYSNINALINGEKEYGVTLHYIEPGIDDGDIVDCLTVPLEEEDTGLSLYLKGEEMCLEIIKNNIYNILNGNIKRINQNELVKQGRSIGIYSIKGTKEKKYIPLEALNEEKSIRIIRAFDSDYHEPAYTKIEGRKIYLRCTY